MKTNFAFSIIIIIWALMWATALYFAPQLPDEMATHWNAQGVADGFMSKTAGLIFVPMLSIIFIFLHRVIPMMDPSKFSGTKFAKYYHFMFIILMVFMYLTYLYGILYNSGYHIDIQRVLPLLLGALFYIIALMLRNTEPNIPNLDKADPRKIEQFQKNASLAFKICAICILSAFFFPEYIAWLMLIPIGIATLYTVVSAFRI